MLKIYRDIRHIPGAVVTNSLNEYIDSFSREVSGRIGAQTEPRIFEVPNRARPPVRKGAFTRLFVERPHIEVLDPTQAVDVMQSRTLAQGHTRESISIHSGNVGISSKVVCLIRQGYFEQTFEV
jgi:hypothetical protein